MIAGKWMDMIVGVDIHWVLVPAPPAPPVPTPLPHPFTGIIYDPMGLAVGQAIGAAVGLATGAPITGPVLINNMPASNTGTEGTNKMVMPHIPTPPGIGWAPVPAGLKPPIPGKDPNPGVPGPVPSNDAIIVTGSKTVHVMGTNATRLGDLAMSCGEPVRLPSSTVIAVPMGPPVLIGGPPALDFMAAGMAAIRTSWISGRLNALANRVFGEGSRAANWASKVICFFTGHPVDVASGMVMSEMVDFHLPGPEQLSFERTYYSRSTYEGPLGAGWAHPFDQWISVERGVATYHDGDGREIFFELPPESATCDVPSEGLRIATDAGRITVTYRDRRAFVFVRGEGWDRWRLGEIHTVDEVTYKLRYDAAQRLIEVNHDSGRQFRFKNDEHGRILSITGPDDHAGGEVPLVGYVYDEAGRLARVVDRAGVDTEYGYHGSLLVSETDRRGMSFYFAYDGADPSARCVRTWGDGGVYDHVLHHDLARGCTIVTDSLGYSTTYQWDARGRVTAITDPLGSVRTLEWDDVGLVRETDASGGETSYEYDDAGRVAGLTMADGASVRLTYGTDGEPITLEREDAEVVRTIEVDPREYRIEASWGPVGAVTVEAGGRPVHMVNAQGLPTTVQRNQGLPTQVRDGSGPLAELSWSPSGRVARVTDAAGPLWSFGYGVAGRLATIWQRGGGMTELHHDGEGNIVQVIQNGRPVAQMSYGLRNRVVRRSLAGGPDVVYRYDREGRLLEARRSDGTSYRFEYDPAGRAVLEITPLETSRAHAYDGDRVVEFVETPVASVANLRRRHQLKHDPVGRIVARKVEGGPDQTFSYDVFGRLKRAGEGDHAVHFAYDAYGNLARESQGGYKITNLYDDRGKRVRRDTDSGWRTESAYDFRGHLVALYMGRHDLDRVLALAWDNAGRIRERIYHDAARTTFEYGRDGLLARETEAWRDGERTRSFVWDANGRIREWRDSETGSVRFTYGTGGALLGVEGDHASWSAGYDQHGRRDVLRGVSLRLDDAGRVRSARGHAYDPLGRLVRRPRPTPYGSVMQRLEYDGLNRLRTILTEDGQRSYAYDALGRLVRAEGPLGVTHYRWDGTHLLEMAGTTIRQFVMDDARPLATACEDSVLAFSVDWRGVPRALFDSGGKRVWAGEVWEVDSGSFASPEQPFGWPGHVWDAEAGLWLCGQRFWDPWTWRFVTPDPLGLEGGLDPYGFVSDPNAQRDPLGLILDVQPAGGYDGYPPPDFRDALAEQRAQRGVTNGRNIALLELKDGRMVPFVSGEGGHSERQLLNWMDENGIRATQVRRIYTEMSPCTRIGGCFDALRARFQHLKTRVPVLFNFPWHGDMFDMQRHRAIEDFKATCA